MAMLGGLGGDKEFSAIRESVRQIPQNDNNKQRPLETVQRQQYTKSRYCWAFQQPKQCPHHSQICRECGKTSHFQGE